MNSITQEDDRINLRLKHRAKLMLERAASVEGQTLSKFILQSALARAENTIKEHDVMRLNDRDAQAFFDALATPIFNEKLIAALREHERRIISK